MLLIYIYIWPGQQTKYAYAQLVQPNHAQAAPQTFTYASRSTHGVSTKASIFEGPSQKGLWLIAIGMPALLTQDQSQRTLQCASMLAKLTSM